MRIRIDEEGADITFMTLVREQYTFSHLLGMFTDTTCSLAAKDLKKTPPCSRHRVLTPWVLKISLSSNVAGVTQ